MLNADRLKAARTEYNKHGKQTLREVADTTWVSASLISDLEAGSPRDVGYQKISRLADHYGVAVGWLLDETDTRTADMDVRGVCEYTGLSEAAVERLVSFKQENDRTGTSDILSLLLEAKGITVLLDGILTIAVASEGEETRIQSEKGRTIFHAKTGELMKSLIQMFIVQLAESVAKEYPKRYTSPMEREVEEEHKNGTLTDEQYNAAISRFGKKGEA
ncbi:MAG: helix-turn-helix transcriptional regulator [Oscillospiraceae bacterium]|nr:helix-turn-helix transcriptional regulator [Oscillospiraceae bacterium]